MSQPAQALIWVQDPLQARYLEHSYRGAGFEVRLCSSYAQLKKQALARGPQPLAVILGLAHQAELTYKQLRSLHQALPLACLLVLSPIQDAGIIGEVLAAGADDCLIQPFDAQYLLALTRARLQRIQTVAQASLRAPASPSLRFGPLSLEPQGRMLTLDRQRIKLTITEFALLHLLAQHANQPLSRDQIHQWLWQVAEPANSRRLDNFVFSLRKKLPTNAGLELLTYYGEGFCLKLAD